MIRCAGSCNEDHTVKSSRLLGNGKWNWQNGYLPFVTNHEPASCILPRVFLIHYPPYWNFRDVLCQEIFMKHFGRMSYAVIVIIVLAFTCAPVFAQAEKPAPAQQNPATPTDQLETEGSALLRLVDLNHDGLISQNEWDDFFAD